MNRKRKPVKPRKKKAPSGRRGITPSERMEICKAVCKLYETDEYPAEECCKANSISVSQFNQWTLDFPEIGKLYKAAKEVKHANFKSNLRNLAQRSIVKLVKGFSVDEVTKEGIASTGPDGQQRVTVTNVKTVTKHFAPQPTAVIFALKNVDSETFKDRVQTEIMGEGGKPIEIEQKTKIEFSHDDFASLFKSVTGASDGDTAGSPGSGQ